MKIAILLCYYERPNMVRFALNSIKNAVHKDWHLYFVDDSSTYPGAHVVSEILAGKTDKVTFFNTQDKEKKQGSSFAKYWNQALEDTDADIAIMLCDDDALFPGYLKLLSDWYEDNPEKDYSYGHVVPFNPFETQDLYSVEVSTDWWLNKKGPVNPYCNVDASQVSWRVSTFRENDIKFPYPQTKNLDAALYNQLFACCGPCVPNNLIAQYKGIHADQLGTRASNYNTRDLEVAPL